MKKHLIGFLFILISHLTGCHKASPKDPEPSNDADLISKIYTADMIDLEKAADQETGWPSAVDCDGTLWAGIARAAGDDRVILGLADNALDGAIKRSPITKCTPASRDMALGYVYGRYVSGDLSALQRVADYLESHSNHVSDDAAISSIDPSSLGVLGRAIKKLSNGDDTRKYAANLFACLPPLKDFERHLQMLLFLLESDISGSMTRECVDMVGELKREYPDDALVGTAAAIYSGDFKTPMAQLISGYTCPSYVRGADTYCLTHKVFIENIIIKRHLGK